MIRGRILVKRQSFVGFNVDPIEDHYDIGEELGAGAFGKVVKATHKQSQSLRAIKILQKPHIHDYRTFQTELDLLRALDHPHVIRVFEAFESDLFCYLVTDYCEGGELLRKLVEQGHFAEAEAAAYMRQIISAVAFCHSRGICHRDLKPDNCLFLTQSPDSDIKLIDFGLGQRVDEEELMFAALGTPYYIAPEVVEGSYDVKADCWSLGVMLYLMLSGTPPFDGKNNEEILSRVKTGYFSFKALRGVSETAKDLIAQLLRKDPALRLSAHEALSHPWLSCSSPRTPHSIRSEILVSLRTFLESNIMKKIAYFYIATHISERDCENLRRTFTLMDLNGDGMLSAEELKHGLEGLGKVLNEQQLKALCLLLDTNQSGCIEYTEFIAACLEARHLHSMALRAAFRYFDVDNSGKVTIAELREVIQGHSAMSTVPSAAIESVLKEIDTDGDGCIDYEEFICMMKKRA